MFSDQSLKNRKVLKGYWGRDNNYGTIRAKADCYQKFMKNPGFVINVDEETEVKFSLKASKYMDMDPNLTICVIEIMDDFKFKFLVDGKSKLGH